MKKNDIFTVEITDITNTGSGVARVEGIVVFVQGAVTGDTVEIKIIKLTSGYAVARTEKIIVPSPFRVESDCPISKRCGGCVYRNIDYAHELEIKRKLVENAFRKQGLCVSAAPTLSGGTFNNWRNKIAVPVSEMGKFGYYCNHSHEIIPCEGCPSHISIFNDIIKYTENFLGGRSLGMRHISMRTGKSGVLVCIIAKSECREWKKLADELMTVFPSIVGVLLNLNRENTNVIYGSEFITLSGLDYIDDELLGMTFRVSMPSFYQVNHTSAELAYSKLLEIADIHDGDTLLDLYCGTGTIGLFLKKNSSAARLTGVEIISSAVENAKLNAKMNQVDNCEFICCDAGNIDIASFNANVIVCDPPRKGLSENTVKAIIEALPEKIAYMSCDPDTLARDCKAFSEAGYTIGEATPIDMFPRAGHVESVVCLSREKADDYVRISVHTKDLKTSMN